MKPTLRTLATIMLAWGMIAMGIPRADAATEPTIANGASVVIKMTIQIPEDHMMIPEQLSEYTHGHQELFPALEEALEGKRVGDKAQLDLNAEQAFGPYDPAKRFTISRSELPSDAKIGDVGETPEGHLYTIVDLADAAAILDFNHPLAGKRIVLNVTVVKVDPET
ncbi:hypothetical protein YTPLAS18_27970 [Nitrospira sp.]|nr:hypothetical protein YTPLAS18_27970 [Nitrospira sp.]